VDEEVREEEGGRGRGEERESECVDGGGVEEEEEGGRGPIDSAREGEEMRGKTTQNEENDETERHTPNKPYLPKHSMIAKK
jgi:hypothetical protein